MTTTRLKRRTRAGASMLLTMMLTAALPVRASAQLTCGGTIGPGGAFTMSNDLTSCPGTGLTVVGPVVLDMNQRSVSCSGLSTGIRIVGKKATVRSGQVLSCTVGVDLEGDGGHTVREVRAVGNAIGFGVSTDGNLLTHNVAQTHSGGFQVNGDRNKLVGNLSVNTSNAAFQVFGNNNAFVQNAVQQAGSGFRTEPGTIGNSFKENTVTATATGFNIAGAKHVLKSNTANRSIVTGFRLAAGPGGHALKANVSIGIRGEAGSGSGFDVGSGDNVLKSNRAHEHEIGFGVRVPGNVLSGNVATGNVADGFDQDVACAGNTWKNNVFLRAFPDCAR
ncbi:MAG: hypothetical protein ABIR79_06265 [Candidatus Binatia bacterium]